MSFCSIALLITTTCCKHFQTQKPPLFNLCVFSYNANLIFTSITYYQENWLFPILFGGQRAHFQNEGIAKRQSVSETMW